VDDVVLQSVEDPVDILIEASRSLHLAEHWKVWIIVKCIMNISQLVLL
jgi:hypothetical protein